MRVLVATDLSVAADEAVRQGDAWARARGGRLAVCHVVPTLPSVHPLFPQMYEEEAETRVTVQKHAALLVDERVRNVTERTPEDFEAIIDDGSPDTGVLGIAERIGASLLVIGGYGTTNMPRLLLGSVAAAVVRHAACPVLVARARERGGGVFAATDLSEASHPAMEMAADEARRRGVGLTIFHAIDAVLPPALAASVIPKETYRRAIAELERATLSRLSEAASKMGLPVDTNLVVGFGPPARAIVRSAEERGAELLVVGRHGKSGLARLAIGSIAEEVVRAAHCSVIVVPQ